MKFTMIVAALVVSACAKGGENGPSVDASGSPIDGTGGSSDNPCPANEFATSVAASGQVTCAPVEEPTKTAIDARCSVYLGARDSCDGCTNPPTKWGSTSPLMCTNGAGNNTCTMPTLGGSMVQTFGLDLDGDTDGNDKLYGTLHCVTADRPPVPAPCAPGWAVTGKLGATWMCAPIGEAAIGYVRNHCSVYLGWQDGCDGCITPPGKWGSANDGGCKVGAGGDNTCITTTLGGETINLFGLNFDGDVDGNDKLHFGLRCDAALANGTSSMRVCPPGQFVQGTSADGSFRCEDPAPVFAKYFSDHCSMVFGWRDSCDGCTEPPAKWGTVGASACSNGAGADNTCTQMTLGGETIEMFGLSPDGDVDGNDKLYVGFRCQ